MTASHGAASAVDDRSAAAAQRIEDILEHGSLRRLVELLRSESTPPHLRKRIRSAADSVFRVLFSSLDVTATNDKMMDMETIIACVLVECIEAAITSARGEFGAGVSPPRFFQKQKKRRPWEAITKEHLEDQTAHDEPDPDEEYAERFGRDEDES